MTKYIKPRKQPKFLTFILGFLTGFVSFILFVVCLGYFVFYGLTIKDIETFTRSTIIEEDSGLSFAKNLTLNDMISSVKTAYNHEDGFSIAVLEEALGEDIEIDIDAMLPENIDVEMLEGYLDKYTDYSNVKDIPVQKLGTVLEDFITKVTLADVIELSSMTPIDINTYYEQYGLESFDKLIEYIYAEEDIKSLKDIKVASMPQVLGDIITLARITDVIEIYNGFVGEDKAYEAVSKIFTTLNLNYSIEEVKDIVTSVTAVFGENASVLDTIQNVNLLFTEELGSLLSIKDRSALQFLPFTKQSTLADLNEILNTYFGDLPINKLSVVEPVSFDAKLDYDENTTFNMLGSGDLKNYSLGELIGAENGIFSLDIVKNIHFYDFAQNNPVFSNLTLQNLINKGIVDGEKIENLSQFSSKTLLELANDENAKNIILKDIFSFRTGVLYNPEIYTYSLKGVLEYAYMNIRMCDLNDFGIGFDTVEGEGEGGILTTLPKNTTLKDVMNLNIEKIFKDKTIGELLQSGNQEEYEGFIANFADIKITDLLNKSLLECFENSDTTVGDLLGLDSSADDGLLNCLKDIKLNNLSEDINSILIGDILQLNVNTNYNPDIEGSKKYVKDNNEQSSIVLAFANYTIMEIKDVFSDDKPLGELLGLEKNENDEYVSDSKIFELLAKFSIKDLTNAENSLFTLKIGDILGLEKNNQDKYISENDILLAISEFSLNEMIDGTKLKELKIGSLLGLDTDNDGNFVSENKTLQAISHLSILDLTNGTKLYELTIGDLLGLEKDGNGKYVSQNKTLQAISHLSIADLTDSEDKLSIIKIGDLLGLTVNELTGKYETTNKALQAIADFSIGDLTSENGGFYSLKIGDIIGLEQNPNYLVIDNAQKFIKDNNQSYSAVIIKIANMSINNISGELDSLINNLLIGEIFEDENQTPIIKCLSNYKINEISDAINNQIQIGQLLGLNYNEQDSKYESDSKIISLLANETLSSISNNMNGIIKQLTIGDCLDIKVNGEFPADTPTLIKVIYDTKIENISSKINTLTVGEILGTPKNECSKLIQSIYDENINNLSSVIDSLTIADVVNVSEGSFLFKIKDEPITNIENAVNNLAITDICQIDDNSILSLLPANTTVANLGNAQIDITNKTIGDLIGYGLIDDNNYSEEMKQTTVQDILDAINNPTIWNIIFG